MRVLLTGAPGFIGSHVARELLAGGHEVIGTRFRDEPTDRIADLLGSLTLLDADLASDDLDALVASAAPEACIHLAWYVEPGAYLTSVAGNLASLSAGARLLAALDAAGCRRAVIAGTCLEPSASGRGTPPASIYAAAKAALHEVAMHLDRTQVACAHIFHLYGPSEKPQRLVPAIIAACLAGETIDVTSGQQRRDFLHVSDVASAIVAVAASDLSGQVDICSGTSVPLLEVFAAVGEATGRTDLIQIGARERPEGEPDDISGDSGPLRSTGWLPRLTLSEGIADTVSWWRGSTAGDTR